MKREDVQARLDAFLELARREQEIKEELLALNMMGHKATEQGLNEQIQCHDDLIREIARIRHEEMLPILEEVAAFIAQARKRGRVG